MKTIQINIFQFSELSDSAKDKAREWYRRGLQPSRGRALEAAYDWDNADAQVDENIIANEYEFTEDGEVAK